MNKYLYGLDLSIRCTGVTIYDLTEKKFVYIGSLETAKIYATKQNKGLYLNAVKLRKIADWFLELVEKYPPEIVAIERGFSRYKNETQAIFRCHGLFNFILWKTPQIYYPPKKVKAAILKGDATKEQVSRVIQNNFLDIEFKNTDESDSFAVALTYLIENELIDFEKPVL